MLAERLGEHMLPLQAAMGYFEVETEGYEAPQVLLTIRSDRPDSLLPLAAELADRLRRAGLISNFWMPGERDVRRADAAPLTSALVTVVTPALRLWLDPGSASPEVVAGVLRALSDLHEAAGGTGLRFRLDEGQTLVLDEEHA